MLFIILFYLNLTKINLLLFLITIMPKRLHLYFLLTLQLIHIFTKQTLLQVLARI